MLCNWFRYEFYFFEIFIFDFLLLGGYVVVIAVQNVNFDALFRENKTCLSVNPDMFLHLSFNILLKICQVHLQNSTLLFRGLLDIF